MCLCPSNVFILCSHSCRWQHLPSFVSHTVKTHICPFFTTERLKNKKNKPQTIVKPVEIDYCGIKMPHGINVESKCHSKATCLTSRKTASFFFFPLSIILDLALSILLANV